MRLLEQWNLRGPVYQLRSELAEWDISQEQWQAALRCSMVLFRPDGKVIEREDHNSNGSVSRSKYSYDEAGRLLESTFQLDDGPLGRTIQRYDQLGRLVREIVVDGNGSERESAIYSYDNTGRRTKLQVVPKREDSPACATGSCGGGTVYGVEGAEMAYGAEDVATITTYYDHLERPCEALFQNESGTAILRVFLTRDNAGRLVKEESRCGDQAPFRIAQTLENAPAQERAADAAILAQLFNPDRVMWSTTYRYDDRGRRIECSTSMWALHTDHSIWEYDEHDNAIRTIHDDTVSGDLQADESGNLQRVSPKSFRREGRLEYKYDSHGNWTERVVSGRYEVNPEFQRSNIERRTIMYYSSRGIL